MKRWFVRVVLVVVFVAALPFSSPAPLIYRPGEGWTYEPVGGGGGAWRQARAKDQLQVAQDAFDKKDYTLALKASHRVVQVWPLSDYAPQAQYLVGRCYEAKGKDEKAFKEYQLVLDKHPKFTNYQEIVERQYHIANLHLAGKWFKLWGYIPYPSMDKTAQMYEKIVKNGPYSEVGPEAQLKIGAAREKQSNYPLAVKAYELASDRYHDRPQIAAEALYREGMAYRKESQRAEYDQSTAGSAISTFSDFMALYPNDTRVAEAQKVIGTLKTEQARGSFETAKFYEKYKKWRGAVVYYNEVLLQDPSSPRASEARRRIDALKQRTQQQASKESPPAKPSP
ncbi:TPR repeats containing protein [Verrucomicrobia bacterium]|nr:TPR repeats containing protein [Verrucomicrobiota bacterium]